MELFREEIHQFYVNYFQENLQINEVKTETSYEY